MRWIKATDSSKRIEPLTMTFPVPENEDDRIAALEKYAILDSPPEEVFDRITRLVSAYLNVPIALVSLVDGSRQWFKSKVGLDVTQTNREIAFCGHTILQNEIMIVSDASKDERFSDSPLVVGNPNIAFYAGAPITTSDGYNLGTLCAIDRVPRHLSLEQKTVLTDLANMVMDALEMRLINARISNDSNVQLKKFQSLHQEMNLIGQVFHKLDYSILFFDKKGTVLSMNNATSNIFGYSSSEVYGQHIAMFFPKNHAQLFNKIFNQQVGNNDLKINNIPPQVTGLRKDGSIFPLEINISEINIEQGTAFRAQFRDTTNSDLADRAIEHFKFPLDISQNFIFMFREGVWNFDYVSQGAINFTGFTQEELHNMALFDLDDTLSKQRLQGMLTSLLNTEKPELSYETLLKIKGRANAPVQIGFCSGQG